MHDADVFADRQVGAERQFLKHAANAAGAGGRDAVTALLAAVGDGTLMRCQPAIDDVDDGGFSGAIMAYEPEAFPRADDEIGAIQRLDRAEHDLHAARGDDFFRLDDVIHEQLRQ
ncbi:hypothetical protein D3C78_1220300 [compost metagenome]